MCDSPAVQGICVFCLLPCVAPLTGKKILSVTPNFLVRTLYVLLPHSPPFTGALQGSVYTCAKTIESRFSKTEVYHPYSLCVYSLMLMLLHEAQLLMYMLGH